MNARVALRLVRGWSQREAAEQWNLRWPANPKTFKNFSYWELWPSRTGHAPSLDVLARLAELYECGVADLLCDCADFRSADAAYQPPRPGERLSELAVGGDAPGHLPPPTASQPWAEAHTWIERLERLDVNEIATLASAWAKTTADPSGRMAVLLKVSAGLSLAAAASDRHGTEFRAESRADSRGEAGAAPPAVGKSSEGLPGFTGIWHSRHVHPGDSAGAALVDEHYVAIRQEGRRLVGESVATAAVGSSLRLDLELSGQIATGTWQIRRAPVEGRPSVVNHGVLQLVVDRRGQRMTGRWAGFDHESRINSDVWEFDRVDEAQARQHHTPPQQQAPASPAEPAVPCAQRSNR